MWQFRELLYTCYLLVTYLVRVKVRSGSGRCRRWCISRGGANGRAWEAIVVHSTESGRRPNVRKMDSLENRCGSFTRRRAHFAPRLGPSRHAPVVHVAHARRRTPINHVTDRTDDGKTATPLQQSWAVHDSNIFEEMFVVFSSSSIQHAHSLDTGLLCVSMAVCNRLRQTGFIYLSNFFSLEKGSNTPDQEIGPPTLKTWLRRCNYPVSKQTDEWTDIRTEYGQTSDRCFNSRRVHSR